MTYQSKYSTFLFDSIIFGIPAIVGIAFWTWSIFTDFKNSRYKKNLVKLITPIAGLIFASIIFIMSLTINSTFNKPTLLRIYYDGDFNGVGIDFKTDGTYIFDNSAIGLSDYQYGNYEINVNKIILDKNEMDNTIKTNRLEIYAKTIEYPDRTETEDYVCQVNEKGARLKNMIEFRVVIDNRNE